MDFNSWIANLREVLQEQDSPLVLRNGNWEVVDRKMLWANFGSRIFDVHLDQFKKCAVEVLTELDPQFDLAAEERYAASIHGKTLKHSSGLRKGLAETLALLGCHGEVLENCSQHKSESTIILAIREIFEKADWQLWASINDLLPTLAEAAPGEFLRSVEKALEQTPCPFDELFAQEGTGSFGGRNYMTGLFWALEGLSWSEEHLVHCTLILADLASHDPGGNSGNRPVNSLITILLPWFPQTLASIDKRITSIKAIREDHPDVAWKVLLSLLPNSSQTTSGSHKTRWRNILPEEWKPEVTNKAYWDQVAAYAELSVEMARENLDKLTELVSNLDNLPKPSFEALLKYLSSDAITGLPENQRLPIWTSLTAFARKHRRHIGAEWALDEEDISKIETAAEKLSPVSPEGLHRNLFSNRDFDLYEESGNYEEQRKLLNEQRQQAVQEIFNLSGIQGVLKFIEMLEASNQVGWYMGIIAPNKLDIDLLPDYLDVENTKQKQFFGSFVWSRYQHQGWKWVDGLNRDQWTSVQLCQFLMYLPFEVDTWHRVSDWLVDEETLYWEKIQVNPYQSDSDLLIAIDKLLSVNRPQAAIDCLHYRLYKKLPLDSKRTVKALLDAVSVKEPKGNIDPYRITELIKALQNDPKTDQGNLFHVEWAYLPLLDRHNKAEPKTLETRLANEPDFFCEVIRLIYRSKNEPVRDEEADGEKIKIASNAFRLLNEWKKVPGMNEGGTFSAEKFEVWLKTVKDECRDTGHLEVAMIKVGEVLYYCPEDPKGLWIAQAAASALNAKDAEEMRRGFRTEVFNSRGVHWVDPSGSQEQNLAIKWRKKAEAIENEGFARFAVTLRELAESYDREADQIIKRHEPKGE